MVLAHIKGKQERAYKLFELEVNKATQQEKEDWQMGSTGFAILIVNFDEDLLHKAQIKLEMRKRMAQQNPQYEP